MSWLKRLFKRKKKTDIPMPIKETLGKTIKKIAILVGHGAGDSGAIAFNKVEEHFYNSEVSKFLSVHESNKDLKIFFKSGSGWVPTYLKVALFKPDLTIELHLNAANGTAVGCEVLCLSNDENSAKIGRSFAKEFTQKFDRKLRREQGINFISSGDRGYGNLKGCKALSNNSILVEPFFCDNKNEWVDIEVYSSFLLEWVNNL